eukprot:2159396-Pyramimonas_sp.AAC.1
MGGGKGREKRRRRRRRMEEEEEEKEETLETLPDRVAISLLRTLGQRPELIRRKYSNPVAVGGSHSKASFPVLWETNIPH